MASTLNPPPRPEHQFKRVAILFAGGPAPGANAVISADGRHVAFTSASAGLSGAGKSSLVFDTLHAEGQRRYVETFSPYTRQFLEMLDRPKVDSIENIRPSIAIRQSNTVKTSRSTVGTMTELCDYFKVWFCQVSELIDPATGQVIEDDNPQSIWRKALAAHEGQLVRLVHDDDAPTVPDDPQRRLDEGEAMGGGGVSRSQVSRLCEGEPSRRHAFETDGERRAGAGLSLPPS